MVELYKILFYVDGMYWTEKDRYLYFGSYREQFIIIKNGYIVVNTLKESLSLA